jgi:hypothetical protein
VRFESCACDVLEATIWLDIFLCMLMCMRLVLAQVRDY